MPSNLALYGGTPVRTRVLPYGRQWIDAADVEAVVEVLRSDWLTTGPFVERLEEALRVFTGAPDMVAVSSGTAALHAAMHALDIGPGDEVVVPTLTFAASANCVVYLGGTPIFSDVAPDTLLLDPAGVEDRITDRTRAIIAVDYAGQPCDYAALREIADRHGLALVADASHSLGASLDGRQVGTLADITTFSFHPVKHITTGEGGAAATIRPDHASRMRRFRNHGIDTDHRQREAAGSWFYEMVELGYNYRITDLQCALGERQLRRLPEWIERRRAIAERYDEALAGIGALTPLNSRSGTRNAYHLYVVQLELEGLSADRATVFDALRAEGIGVNVHYIPVHLHPFYRQRFGTGPGQCPVAEAAYQRILSLPMFPAMTDADIADVINAVAKVARAYSV